MRASGGGRRGGARALTPLVGREEELDLLARRWERARKGEGQLALIVGEPGLGKSRLIEEFRARLGETPHTWVEWSSSQLLQNTPLHPIAEWGRLRFGGGRCRRTAPRRSREHAAADRARRRRICAAARAAGRRPAAGGPRGETLAGGIAPPATRGADRLGSRRRAHAADRARLRGPALGRSDLARPVAGAGRARRAGAAAHHRDDAAGVPPALELRSHHGVISLAPLDRAQVARMVGEIAPRHALPKDVVDGVTERTGGVPLFVEEVTRLLLERGEQGGVQAIPPTLQQSLAARLDRLGAAREIAQIGAVLGRDFSYALLRRRGGPRRRPRCTRRSTGSPTPTSCSSRARAAGELSLQARADPGRRLRQPAQEPPPDAAPPRRRSRCARAPPSPKRSPIISPRPASTISAIEWWGKAGDQALRRSAFQEAIAHLGKAIEMADKGGRDGAAGARRLGRSDPATDAVARRLRQRALRGARLRRAGNDGSLRQSPRVGVWRQGCARSIGGRLRLMGRQLRAWRVAIDAGARSGLPQRRRSETQFARGRRRSSRRRDDVLVRRRVSRGAGSLGTGRSPCSNPAVTMIWPFASGMTPASAQCLAWRLRHGLSARSIARFRSSTACRRGSRASPMSARSQLDECTRPCSN